MKNPYQETVDWLNSDDGFRWSARTRRNSVWNPVIYSFRPGTCLICDPEEPRDPELELLSYENSHDNPLYRFSSASMDFTTDGPYADVADTWISADGYHLLR